MATDPRLQWRQLNQAQPNVAGLMAQVRGGINDAAGAAESILGSYQAGQELKSEQELVRRIGGMNQDQLRSAFQGGQFDDLNLGTKGVEILNNAMGQRADVRSTNVQSDRTQASIGWGNDLNSRQNAAEGRRATEFGWDTADREDSLARRAALRGMAPEMLAAEERAFREGQSRFSNSMRTESGGGSDEYDTLYGHRNRHSGTRVSNMTLGQASEFADSNGAYARSVNNEIGRIATPMGKFQIVGDTLRQTMKDLNLPDNIPFSPAVQEQLGTYLAQQRVNGPRSREAMRKGMRQEWAGYENLSNPELDAVIDEIRSQPAVTRDSVIAAAEGDAASGPRFTGTPVNRGGSDIASQLAETGLFTGSEALGIIDPIRQAAVTGQQIRDEQFTEFQNDILAGAVESVVQSPEVLNSAEAEAMIRDILSDQGDFSNAQIDAQARRAVEMIGSSEALGSDMAGGGLSPIVQGAIEQSAQNTIDAGNLALSGQDQARALRDIPKFAEDPTGNLENALDIPNDPETRGDYRSEYLRRHINTLADRYGVTPAVMAVAMRDAFIPDPGEANEKRWWDIDWTRNTIANRFDEDVIAQTVQQLTPERQAEFNRMSSNQEIRSNQLNQNAQQQIQAERRLNKALQIGDLATAERMEARLQQLREQAATVSTQEILQGTR